MIDHDRLFKKLLSVFFFEFIDLFLPDMAAFLDRSSISFLDKELFAGAKDRKAIADLVIKARFKDRDSFFLIHIEQQAQRQPDFGLRLFRYFARLHEQYNLPVYPIVVFSFARPRREQSCVYEVRFPGLHVLRFRYRTVQLNRLNWRHYVKQENPVAAALMAKMQFAPHERAEVKLECLRLIATLKLDRDKTRLILSFLDSYLALTAAEQQQLESKLKELDVEQQEEIMATRTTWWQQARKEGLQEGRQEGLQEGRAEGRQEGAASVVSCLLSKRFGRLNKSMQAKLRTLSPEQFEQLGEALLDFKTVEELRQWLVSATRSG